MSREGGGGKWPFSLSKLPEKRGKWRKIYAHFCDFRDGENGKNGENGEKWPKFGTSYTKLYNGRPPWETPVNISTMT